MSRHRAMVAGTMALDLCPRFPDEACCRDELLAEGKTIYIEGIDLTLGGLVANTGLAMHRLGSDVVLTSKVGGDPLGEVVSALLKQTDVPYKLTSVPDGRTSATIVTVPKGSDRIFWHQRGVSQEYSFATLEREVLEQSDLFHFGYPTGMRCMYADGGENLRALYREVKELGLTTSLDLSLPGLTSESGQADWKGILGRTLPYVDIFLPSLEETLFLLRKDSYLKILERAGNGDAIDYISLDILRELGDEVLELGVKVFVLKLGKKGMYLRTAGAETFQGFGALKDGITEEWWGREILEPPFLVTRICSTNGAGDTAIAGFLTGLMEGACPEQCLHLASGAAACRIESSQGAEGICGKQSVLERVESGWEKQKIEGLETEYWKWDKNRRAYFSVKDALIRE